jgi:hypothetical protein
MKAFWITLLICVMVACGAVVLAERGAALVDRSAMEARTADQQARCIALPEERGPAPNLSGHSVTLLIFSGLPDPVWALSEAQWAELEALWRALPQGVAVAEPEGLGYRGFALGAEPFVRPDLRAYAGVVHVSGDGEEMWFVDAGRTVERYLLESGREALDEGLYADLLRDLEPTPGDFAIYLTTDDVRPADLLGEVELATLPVRPTPIISIDDIVWYEASSHRMMLAPEIAGRIGITQIPVSGQAFVVYVGSEPIYVGGFWTPLSSLSFDGVTIMPGVGGGDTLFRIELGYPGPGFYRGDDPRSDPRILAALERVGKLR